MWHVKLVVASMLDLLSVVQGVCVVSSDNVLSKATWIWSAVFDFGHAYITCFNGQIFLSIPDSSTQNCIQVRTSHDIISPKVSNKRNSTILSRLYQRIFYAFWADLLTISLRTVVWLIIKSEAGTFPYKVPNSINDCANLSSSAKW